MKPKEYSPPTCLDCERQTNPTFITMKNAMVSSTAYWRCPGCLNLYGEATSADLREWDRLRERRSREWKEQRR